MINMEAATQRQLAQRLAAIISRDFPLDYEAIRGQWELQDPPDIETDFGITDEHLPQLMGECLEILEQNPREWIDH